LVTPLFRRLLGSTIETLPPVLRAAHDARDDQHWVGRAEVRASRNPLARLLCRMMRLPPIGEDMPVSVAFDRRGDREYWHRSFAGRRYESVLHVSETGLMIERMGPATNIFRVSVTAETLHLDLIGFRFLGIPVPFWLRPHCHAVEREDDGRYVFDVPVSVPWLGAIIHYTGRMERRDD
jgi:hypothetical protein